MVNTKNPQMAMKDVIFKASFGIDSQSRFSRENLIWLSVLSVMLQIFSRTKALKSISSQSPPSKTMKSTFEFNAKQFSVNDNYFKFNSMF
jgi:hypothetical protein